MIRLHLFEYLEWFPAVVWEEIMHLLRFMISKIAIYEPVIPLLLQTESPFFFSEC